MDVPDSKVQQTCIQVACQPLQREIRFADSMQVQGALCQFSFSKWTNPSLVKISVSSSLVTKKKKLWLL